MDRFVAERERIGVFGGTFDPLHNTHCAIARTALRQARLDRVLFVVSARPPHKNKGPYASPEQRYKMVEAALSTEARLEACRIEIDRDGPSYMRDTLEELGRVYARAAFFLVVGFDSVVDLPQWKDPEAILERARLLVARRPGQAETVPEVLESATSFLDFDEDPLSSTEVRYRITSSASFDHLVPPAVAQYIRQERLYCPSEAVRACPRAEEYLAYIVGRLPEGTLRHSIRCAEAMLDCCAIARIPEEQGLTAALLHDSAKGMSKKELLAAAQRLNLPLSETQRSQPKLLHGPVAAALCAQELGIDDSAVLEAIAWHTTGKPGLEPVGLALYLCDYTEPMRQFPEAETARALLREEGLVAAVRHAARCKWDYVRDKAAVDPAGEAFREWLDTLEETG